MSSNKKSLLKRITVNYELYLFLIPAFLVILLFKYIPMYGVQIAFKDYKHSLGIMGSPFVGLKHFKSFTSGPQFLKLIINNLTLSFYMLAATFPLPILLALTTNQMNNKAFKKTFQTVTYLPHFISIIVMSGMVILFLSPKSGIYGMISNSLNIKPAHLMADANAFRHIFVWSDVWQHMGWNSIIYFAALASVDPTLYEAAKVDGASKMDIIKNIDIPSLVPTMIILLIISVGNIMSLGFEKVYSLQTPGNLKTSEIISTYVYKIGIEKGQMSYSSAIELFNTIINFTLLITVNQVSKRVGETSLW